MLCLAGKVREAQQKKDLELAEKIKLADEKLASVTKLEQDNTCKLQQDQILKQARGKAVVRVSPNIPPVSSFAFVSFS